MLEVSITRDQIAEVLEYADRKQARIFQMTKRPEVLEDWYYFELVEEILKQYILSEYARTKIKKEALTKKINTPTPNLILSHLASEIKEDKPCQIYQ